MRSFRTLTVLLSLMGLLVGCTEAVPKDQGARILAMGDSLLAFRGQSGDTVADTLEFLLDEDVIDRSVPGARMFYVLPVTGALGLNIAKQYRPGPWEWVIVNGGGIDLWFGCGCVVCDRKLNRLISSDGKRGAVPDLVEHIQSNGARVIWLGYMRSPGSPSLIEHCRDDAHTFEARLATMAAGDTGVYFLSLVDMVPFGDTTFHTEDMIHPSDKGIREIAKRIAMIIR